MAGRNTLPLKFPSGFWWGAATAALQIEGSTQVDGREPSIWDDFCRDYPQRIHQGASPEPGCDHYRRWEEDLDWIARLGHNAYRFSLSWPRGRDGLDFYDRLVDGLCQRGIAPLATLYHWDLPSRLGSWENPEVVEAFASYADLCAQRLGDRVQAWMTLNEPAWSVMNGYITGLHPPAIHDLRRGLIAAHHLLQAHHRALEVLRSQRVVGRLGLALNLSPVHCAGEGAKDRRAARWANDYLNRWFLEGSIQGQYPRRARRLLQKTLGFDLELSRPQPLDFLGVNYYYPRWVAHSLEPTHFALNTSGLPQDPCQFSLQGKLRFCPGPGLKTDWDWDTDPQGLEELLVQLSHDFPELPLLVSENGIGLRENWSEEEIQDLQRIEFVGQHLEAIQRARQQGASVLGYLMWSLMDNFSWLNGYSKRYGFLAIHPTTLERRPKASAWWFRNVIKDST